MSAPAPAVRDAAQGPEGRDLPARIAALPFDVEAMVAGLRRWVECESPSYVPASVDRMMEIAAAKLAGLGAEIERIGGLPGVGGCLRARLPHDAPAGTPGVLVMGHLDTVHPEGTLAKLSWRREDGRIFGPGILDMKGGVFLALEALRALQVTGLATPLPVTVLLTSDEEIGSPATRQLIEDEARRHRYVLVPEPARPNGGVVTGRFAIARFALRATGTPAHAGGQQRADGRSAIRVMAESLIELEKQTCADFSFSVGVIHGGQWVNCVPADCTAEALCMAKTEADLERATALAEGMSFEAGGASLKVEVTSTRPVWNTSAATLQLYEIARDQAERLGFELPHMVSGGGSDGNFTGALGVPTLDGLGLRGAGMHTLDEHIEEASLPERARLMAGLLARLG